MDWLGIQEKGGNKRFPVKKVGSSRKKGRRRWSHPSSKKKKGTFVVKKPKVRGIGRRGLGGKGQKKRFCGGSQRQKGQVLSRGTVTHEQADERGGAPKKKKFENTGEEPRRKIGAVGGLAWTWGDHKKKSGEKLKGSKGSGGTAGIHRQI